MAYGHAERTLATIRLLETETAALLRSLPQLDAEQTAWLQEVSAAGRHVAGALGAGPPPRCGDDRSPRTTGHSAVTRGARPAGQ